MREINFLEENLRQAAIQAKADRRVLWFGLVFAVIALLTWLGLFSYNKSLLSQTEDLATQTTDLETEMLNTSVGRIDYLTFINKTKGISDVVALRHDAIPLITQAVSYLMTEDIVLTSVSYTMVEEYFTMNYSMSNIFEVEKLYRSMLNEEFLQQFQSVDYGHLSRSQSGTYSTSFTFNLK